MQTETTLPGEVQVQYVLSFGRRRLQNIDPSSDLGGWNIRLVRQNRCESSYIYTSLGWNEISLALVTRPLKHLFRLITLRDRVNVQSIHEMHPRYIPNHITLGDNKWTMLPYTII